MLSGVGGMWIMVVLEMEHRWGWQCMEVASRDEGEHDPDTAFDERIAEVLGFFPHPSTHDSHV